MSNAQVVIGHKLLSRTVTMELPRDLLTYANSGGNTKAQDKIIVLFKQQYRQQHQKSVTSFLPWHGIEIDETVASQQRPTGCGCECAGCDQGHHCSREDRDCYI